MEILRICRSLRRNQGADTSRTRNDETSRSGYLKISNNQPALIVQPLAPAVYEVLAIPAEEQNSSSEVIQSFSETNMDRLNAKITSCPVLWSLGRLQVLQLSQDVVLKVGEGIDIDHLATLDLIKAAAPLVPVPESLGILRSGKLVYLFMSMIEGLSLDSIWPSLTRPQKKDIQEQMNTIFSQIRSVKRPSQPGYRSLLGTGDPPRCKDMRREVRVADGKISTEAEFNDFLVSSSEPRSQEFGNREMIRSYLRSDHEIVLTHADVHPRNIMVMKQAQTRHTHQPLGQLFSYRITGILDWELCGWYPSYWEYVKALHTTSSDTRTSDWWAYLPTTAIGSWPAEHAIDLMISRWIR